MRTIKGMQLKAKREAKMTETIYNPWSEDFKMTVQNTPYVFRAGEFTRNVPVPIGKILKKHLVDWLLIKREAPEIMATKAREDTYEEIEIKDNRESD